MNRLPIAYYTSNRGDFRLLALGIQDRISDLGSCDLDSMDRFIAKHQGNYLFCCLSYDLKNQIEKLESRNSDELGFPEMLLWKPELVVSLNAAGYEILQGNLNPGLESELKGIIQELKGKSGNLPEIKFKSRISKTEYLKQVNEIKNEIQLGNVYELNYCQEFYAEGVADFSSWDLLKAQQELAQAPFSAFIRWDGFEVFCASPERFLKREGNHLLSQPIKGTSRRGETDAADEAIVEKLKSDPKERAENIMITDLVRNDLSRIARKSSVKVDELCGVYTFKTVHQLISTISCEVSPEILFSEILKATFPMGSMTGAPKISSMKIIEEKESFKRGLYSGSIGYFKPNGDFDFNVVIRSFMLNRAKKYLSCSVGGAITIASEAEKEYEECLVKVKRMIQLFGDDQSF